MIPNTFERRQLRDICELCSVISGSIFVARFIVTINLRKGKHFLSTSQHYVHIFFNLIKFCFAVSLSPPLGGVELGYGPADVARTLAHQHPYCRGPEASLVEAEDYGKYIADEWCPC